MNGMSMTPDPHDVLGWTVIWVGAAFTIFAFVAAIKVSFWPGERAANHPKHLILRDDR